MDLDRYRRLVPLVAEISHLPARLYLWPRPRGEEGLGEPLLSAGAEPFLSLPLPSRRSLEKEEGPVGGRLEGYGLAYGYFKDGVGFLLLLGPSMVEERSEMEIRSLLSSLEPEASPERLEHLVAGYMNLASVPLKRIIEHCLLLANCLLPYPVEEPPLPFFGEREERLDLGRESSISESAANSSLASEKLIRGFIARGDGEGFAEWAKGLPKTVSGHLTNEPLRQTKNVFICASTIASRAAIEGGMNPALALSASDRFILGAEKCLTPSQVYRLQFEMISYYVNEVSKINQGRPMSELAKKVASYCQRHREEPYRVNELASELSWSRSYLSTRFRKETGLSLNDYFHRYKCEEAKRLLETGMALSEVSFRLAFSSPSHFSRVFKRYVGTTPREYRDRHW